MGPPIDLKQPINIQAGNTLKLEPDNNSKISRAALSRVLGGVITATKFPPDATDQILTRLCGDIVGKQDPDVALDFKCWRDSIKTRINDADLKQIANLGLAIAYLRELYKQDENPCEAVSRADTAVIWQLIRNALTSKAVSRPLCTASRSAQGFLSIALCSLIKDGNIDELFRLHVWLPDGQRGTREVAIHSHQSTVQSWILAGEGIDHSYEVERVKDPKLATHCEYKLSWSDGKNLDAKYKAHQTHSTIVNTKVPARATLARMEAHKRGASYVIPAAKYHVTEVAPDGFHATLFVFDSQRGFVKDAGVLGPKDSESFTQQRDPADVTAKTLAQMVDAVRRWEELMDEGQKHMQRAEWESASAIFSKAFMTCNRNRNFPNRVYHENTVMLRLARVNRCYGRYEIAKEILEKLVSNTEANALHVDSTGELGVVYRHLSLLTDAKRAFAMQYETAKKLNLEADTCRAIGNLGVVNYQLSQDTHDEQLLDLAIAQLQERVRRAQELQRSLSDDSGLMINAVNWEMIGLSRLSLCLIARGKTREATQEARKSLALALRSGDPTVIAMTYFFYGHALMADGQREEAIKQFGVLHNCTPAIALCKEPSREHREYLRELVNAGVDLDVVDEHGYTALDYAVFNEDDESEELVLEALRKEVGQEGSEERRVGAVLRKCYRELFQDKLRPVLLGGDDPGWIQTLRSTYATALATDEEKRKLFLGFSFIPYAKFIQFGRLARSDDEMVRQTKQHLDGKDMIDSPEFIIFFSYRWIGYRSGSNSPDDKQNTQYKRMLAAVEEFLRLHPSIDREKLGIWVVCYVGFYYLS